MPECYVVTLQRAREIDAALTEAGLPRRVSHAISFNIRDGHGPDIELRILPMTPDGEVICECG